MWILFIVISILVLVIFFWQISNLISVISGCLYVKTNRDVIRKALKLADVQKGDVFYDLGSGNGDVLIEASKLGAKAIGLEISPYYYIVSKLQTLKHSDIEIRFQNIKDVSLDRADIVYCYLLPNMLEKLGPKFKKMEKGSRVISVGFPIGKLKNKKEFKVNNRKIYIYNF
jgi:ribosomal protein L11 methylase PrmA